MMYHAGYFSHHNFGGHNRCPKCDCRTNNHIGRLDSGHYRFGCPLCGRRIPDAQKFGMTEYGGK